MKKRGLLILGLLCGILLPLSTQAIENGIYEVEGGNHTIIWNDDKRGDISFTVASGDVPGRYFWGNNYPDGTTSGSQGAILDDNARGGGGDTVINGYSPNPINYNKRQGPCGNGWHIPSMGEWNSLIIALCSLDDDCNAWYSDEEKNGTTGDLIKVDDWSETNRLIRTNTKVIIDDLIELLNISSDDWHWSSSPYLSLLSDVFSYGNQGFVTLIDGCDDSCTISIRCFKNSVIEPQIFTVNFLNDGEYIRSGEIESGSMILAEIISGYNLTGLTKTGYNFSGWVISGSEEMFDIENDVVTTGMTLNAVWEIINYEIDYKLDGGINNENNVTGYTIETESITLLDPTKEGYNFSGWYLDTEFTNQITEITKGTTGDITLYAKWTENKKPSGGSSGGGGRSSRTSSNSEKSTEGQAGNQQPLSPQQASDSSPNREQTVTPLIGVDGEARGGSTQNYTQEFQEAYDFAKEKGITTMPTIQKADMDGKLTRIAMAKMLSQYAMNVLGQKPANIVTPKFNDVTDKQNSDYDDGVTLAYQLGIMGQNMPNNKFRPDDEVTRAEFATALSRMLYHTSDGEYKSTPKYYIHHMEKLVKEGIITKDDPNMKELRGYVMIMLMRSAK